MIMSICTFVNAQIDTSEARYKEPITPFSISNQKSTFSESLKKGVLLSLTESFIKDAHKLKVQEQMISLPWGDGSSKTFELHRTNIFSPDYRLSTSYKQNSEYASCLTYRGRSKDGEAMISLSIFQDALRILVSEGSSNYQISQISRGADEYMLFDIAEAGERPAYSCFTDDNLKFAEEITTEVGKNNQKSSACIPIYIETDFTTFSHFNSDEVEVENYIAALINEVSLLYESEDISISLSGLHITTSESEDYSASFLTAQEALEGFAEHRKNHYFGRLAHFVTVRNLLGGAGWVGTLCTDYTTFEADLDGDGQVEIHHYGPYAVSSAIGQGISSIPIYTWDVFVFAHELGHNIGSPHTHACAWGGENLAIDNCLPSEGGCGLLSDPIPEKELGTIMSYCYLTSTGIDFSRGLGTLPGALMRSNVENASCLLTCDVEEIAGCFDPDYHSYNPFANIDDASCTGTCEDDIKNGDETGVDCGGSLCEPCTDSCSENYIRFEIALDGFPSETSWILIDSTNQDTIESGGPYSISQAHDVIIYEYCLTDGTYSLLLFDQFGDGICCANGSGQYIITDEDDHIYAAGGAFGSEQVERFVLVQEQCPESLILSNTTLQGTYSSSNELMAMQSNTENADAVLRSDNIIIEEFFVSTGATLEIYADGCPE